MGTASLLLTNLYPIHHLYAYKSPVLCSHTCLQTPTPASLLPLQRPRTRPPSRSPIPAFRCTQQTLLRTSTRHVAVQRLQQETEERGEGEQRRLEEEPPLRRNRGQAKEQEGPLHRELPLPRCHLRDLRRQAKGIPLLPLRYLPEAARKRDALVRCHPEGRDALHELARQALLLPDRGPAERSRAALQALLCPVPLAHRRRGAQHDAHVPIYVEL